MKNLLIGALVGALILFIWQFLSWSLLDLHGGQMDHHPNQDSVLSVLETQLDEGTYFMPRLERGASGEENQAYYAEKMGKPWAVVSYYESMEYNMASNMIRGFLTNFLAALILCWLLMKFADLNMKDAVLASVGVGIIGYLTITYLGNVYFPRNTWPDLLDAIVSWALVGAWLGWWLNRETSSSTDPDIARGIGESDTSDIKG